MKKTAVAFLFLFSFILKSYEQPNTGSSYINRAEKLLLAVSKDSLSLLQIPFSDTMRMKWERLPGQRTGLKISHLNETQKIALHERCAVA